MIVLKVTQIGDELALVLNQEALAVLNVRLGDEVSLSASAAGDIVVSNDTATREQRLERGRAFLNKYRSTFEALAK